MNDCFRSTPSILLGVFALLSLEGSARADEPHASDKSAPRWYDTIQIGAFIDAYGSLNYNLPLPQTSTSGLGGNQFRAFDVTNGFAMHWAGLDASYPAEPVGGTIALRIGPGARLYAGSDAQYGLEILKQAFASWKPAGAKSSFTLDFGKFDAPYGSEFSESQLDINYTRSGLYLFAQPLFFTGLRLDWAASDAIDVKLIAANGWNNSVSVNRGKTAGTQLNVKLSDATLLTAGYAVGPQQPDALVVNATGASGGSSLVARSDGATNLRHLIDFVFDTTIADRLRFVFNADFGVERLGGSGAPFRSTKWYGANLAARYAMTSTLSLALRGEYFADPDGWATQTLKPGTKLVDGTMTLAYTPTPNLIFKLDQRLDYVTTDDDDALFLQRLHGTSHHQFTSTLGVVVKTN